MASKPKKCRTNTIYDSADEDVCKWHYRIKFGKHPDDIHPRHDGHWQTFKAGWLEARLADKKKAKLR